MLLTLLFQKLIWIRTLIIRQHQSDCNSANLVENLRFCRQKCCSREEFHCRCWRERRVPLSMDIPIDVEDAVVTIAAASAGAAVVGSCAKADQLTHITLGAVLGGVGGGHG